MNFTKGALIGMVAGTVIGIMNKDNIMSALNSTRREMKKMKRKYKIS